MGFFENFYLVLITSSSIHFSTESLIVTFYIPCVREIIIYGYQHQSCYLSSLHCSLQSICVADSFFLTSIFTPLSLSNTSPISLLLLHHHPLHQIMSVLQSCYLSKLYDLQIACDSWHLTVTLHSLPGSYSCV